MSRNEKLILLLLVLLVFLTRLLQFLFTYVIAVDSVRYINGAALFFQGHMSDALKTADKPPMFFALSAFLNIFIGNIHVSCHITSITFGSLCIIPLYFLTKAVFSNKVAIVTCSVFILSPHLSDTQSDALTDSTFMFFFLSSVTLLWYSLLNADAKLYLLSVVSGALCYLTRTEGIYTLVVTVFLPLGLGLVKWKTKNGLLLFVPIGILLYLLIISPYLFWLKRETGTWTISTSWGAHVVKRIVFNEEDPDRDPKPAFNLFTVLKELALRTLQLNYTIFTLPLIIGGIYIIRHKINWGLVFILFLSMSLVVPAVMGYFQRKTLPSRYVALSVVMLYTVVGLGLVAMYEFLIRIFKNQSIRTALNVLVVICCAILLYKTINPRRYEKLPLKHAGDWIKEQNTQVYALAAKDEVRIEYYSSKDFILFPEDRESLDKLLNDKKHLVVVSDESMPLRKKNQKEMIDNHYELLKDFYHQGYKGKYKQVFIFKPKE